MLLTQAGLSGLIGACTLTLIHESVRRVVPNAPRMDVLGMRAIAKSMRTLDAEPPAGDRLHRLTLVGDVISNSLYYSLVGVGGPEKAPVSGVLLGLAAGIGGVVLPEPLGLGDRPSSRTAATKVMTIGWYLAGGAVAGFAFRLLAKQTNNR